MSFTASDMIFSFVQDKVNKLVHCKSGGLGWANKAKSLEKVTIAGCTIVISLD